MSEVTLHRATNGILSIEWGTPDNQPPAGPVAITPPLLIEMIEAWNARIMFQTPLPPREVQHITVQSTGPVLDGGTGEILSVSDGHDVGGVTDDCSQ